jgi:hypothetical protein
MNHQSDYIRYYAAACRIQRENLIYRILRGGGTGTRGKLEQDLRKCGKIEKARSLLAHFMNK